ncbi:MAG: LamG-like jellyroll fold domain-containing protein [Bacteroidota bacterium]
MRSIALLFTFFLIAFTLKAQNSALSFDGQEEYLNLPHNANYDVGDGFTIEAWILAEEWRDAIWQGSIVNKDNQSPDRGYAFRCGQNGSLSFVMAVDNVWQEAFTGPIMNTNQWHHVAVTVDQGTITLYIDGQEVANHSYSGTPTAASDMPVNIGASPGFGGREFDGVIDEVRIWNVARTRQQIADNATVDLTGTEPGFVAYFPMNEGSGATAGDITSTANDAGLVNMDDSNWVDGYTLPDFDVSVQSVYGIDVVNMIDRPVKLRVDVQNTGTMDISDIDLTVRLDGDTYTTETISSSIAPGELLAYEFKLPLDLIGLSNPTIEVEAAHPDDGNALNNVGSLSIKTGTDTRVVLFDKTLHRNGEQLNSVRMTLPNDLQRYEQMLLNIDLTCPNGGCGIWDVLADLKVVTASGTYELARYITPYGIACGGWTIDVTDFKSVLGGEVEFLSNITVFTTQGWLVDMSIDLIDDADEDTYYSLSRLWEKGYQVYGDPGISYDLEPFEISVQDNTDIHYVRMTITGHGQGNTSNAAEFYDVTHRLHVDGTAIADHRLWKSDCPNNPCANQSGNWQFPRAGWCPGESVTPFYMNTTGAADPGATVSLDYVLQDYTNLLNTGYNNNGHTEPYYRIFSYFIENSSSPYAAFNNLSASNVEPAFNGDVLENLTVDITNNGQSDLENYTINVFYENQLLETVTIMDNIAAGSTVEQLIDLNAMISLPRTNTLLVEVLDEMDNNPGDNVAKAQISTSVEERFAEYRLDLFPNPTNGAVSLEYDAFWEGSLIQVYGSDGALYHQLELNDRSDRLELTSSGAYWYQVIHPVEGEVRAGKIIVTK